MEGNAKRVIELQCRAVAGCAGQNNRQAATSLCCRFVLQSSHLEQEHPLSFLQCHQPHNLSLYP